MYVCTHIPMCGICLYLSTYVWDLSIYNTILKKKAELEINFNFFLKVTMWWLSQPNLLPFLQFRVYSILYSQPPFVWHQSLPQFYPSFIYFLIQCD